MTEKDESLAVFIDFENLALGFKDRSDQFDITRVMARLVEKGHIVVKRAYADWSRFGAFSNALHEAAIELIEIPRRRMTGKNSADMRLCVDAMDLCHSKGHIGTFAIMSGDSDFSPLASKLKENGKTVIGLGMRDATSNLLRDNCDEFIFYEDLESEDRDVRDTAKQVKNMVETEREAFTLLLASLQALRRENRDMLYGSMIKESMKRKQPSFSERTYGWRSFTALLEAAEKSGLVELERINDGRAIVVTRFGEELADSKPPARKKPRRRAPRRKTTEDEG